MKLTANLLKNKNITRNIDFPYEFYLCVNRLPSAPTATEPNAISA